MYVCIQFICTTRFKIGLVLREADAAGSCETIEGQLHLVKVCTLKVFLSLQSSSGQQRNLCQQHVKRLSYLNFIQAVCDGMSRGICLLKDVFVATSRTAVFLRKKCFRI